MPWSSKSFPQRSRRNHGPGNATPVIRVWRYDTDNIIGILHLKDVMRLIVSGETDASIKEVMRKPVFLPDTQNINSLFREMQAKKDAYGYCGRMNTVSPADL